MAYEELRFLQNDEIREARGCDGSNQHLSIFSSAPQDIAKEGARRSKPICSRSVFLAAFPQRQAQTWTSNNVTQTKKEGQDTSGRTPCHVGIRVLWELEHVVVNRRNLTPHRQARPCWFQWYGQTTPVRAVDYRCDDEKNTVELGATSWHNCVAEDSRIPKMTAIKPLPALVHPQTKKKLSCMDCQSPAPTSQNSPFLVDRSAD